MIGVVVSTAGFQAKMKPILATAKNPRAVMAGVGREGANLLKKHFRAKDKSDVNRLAPGRREHFWLRVDRSVQAPIVDESGHRVEVHITDSAFAQKVFGGTITAKRAHNLTIPVEEQAYGRSAKVFEQETGLKLFFLKQHQNIFLAAQIAGHGLQIEYLLTPSVNQKADPTALPEQQKFEDALVAKAQSITNRQINPGGEKK